jgi:hypothetical protein
LKLCENFDDNDDVYYISGRGFAKYSKYIFDDRYTRNFISKKTLTDDINKIIGENNQKYIVNIDEPDVHLCYFRKCKNLLLCKGGFSVLGGILFDGNKLYITKKINNEYQDEKFKNHVKKIKFVVIIL